jgi:hypothetical protein
VIDALLEFQGQPRDRSERLPDDLTQAFEPVAEHWGSWQVHRSGGGGANVHVELSE